MEKWSKRAWKTWILNFLNGVLISENSEIWDLGSRDVHHMDLNCRIHVSSQLTHSMFQNQTRSSYIIAL